MISGILLMVPIAIIGYILYRFLLIFNKVGLFVGRFIPIKTIAGVATANILAIVILLLFIFILGILATSPRIQFFQEVVEKNFLMRIPGYMFFKTLTKGVEGTNDDSHEFDPVIVHFDDNSQLGFLMEEYPEGLSVVFMPDSPNPTSGSVIYVSAERIQQLEINSRRAVQHLQQSGKNADFVNKQKFNLKI